MSSVRLFELLHPARPVLLEFDGPRLDADIGAAASAILRVEAIAELMR